MVNVRSLFGSLLLAAAVPAFAQTPAAPPLPPQANPAPQAAPTQQAPIQDQPFTLKATANLVNLVFTVTDSKGHFIRDLPRQSFGLYDNQRLPEAVISFTQQTDLPLRIGIMLDTSTSIRSRFKFEQDAAYDFFRQILKLKDRAFIEGFDVQIELTQDYTANPALLDAGIRKLRPGGGTALFDALYTTCQTEMLSLKEATAVRKVIVLVSDGEDNYSRALESDAIKMCQRAETSVYTISTDTSPTRGKGGDVLKTIADDTGGRSYFPTRLEDVSAEFLNIEEELRSQYSLEYRPSDFKQDGSFRTIYLRARDSRYHVRSRTGYFAPRADQ